MRSTWFLRSKVGVAYRYCSLCAADPKEARTPVNMSTLSKPVQNSMPSGSFTKASIVVEFTLTSTIVSGT